MDQNGFSKDRKNTFSNIENTYRKLFQQNLILNIYSFVFGLDSLKNHWVLTHDFFDLKKRGCGSCDQKEKRLKNRKADKKSFAKKKFYRSKKYLQF